MSEDQLAAVLQRPGYRVAGDPLAPSAPLCPRCHIRRTWCAVIGCPMLAGEGERMVPRGAPEPAAAPQPLSRFLLEFDVPGDPKGWQRTTPIGYGRSVKSRTQRGYEAAIATAARLAMGAEGFAQGLIACPVRLRATACMAVPKSYAKTKRSGCLAGLILPTGKPDWDNIGKGLCDALTGVVWVDDAQVVDGQVTKVWAEVPLLRVRVEGM